MRDLTIGEKEAVRALVAKVAGTDAERVKDDFKLFDDLGMDSLDFVELVVEIEKDFDVSIPDGQAENIRTVQDCYKVLSEVLTIKNNKNERKNSFRKI